MWLIDKHKFADDVTLGDMIFFDGSGDADLVQLITHVLSNGIEVITRSDWSHVGMACPRYNVVFGRMPAQLAESTIRNGVSGPQLNDLLTRVEECSGPSAYWFKLSAKGAAILDVMKMYDYAMSRIGKDKYSIRAYAHFLLRWTGIKHFRQSHPGESVCSEYVAEILRAGGYPGLNPNECSPETIAKLPIWLKPVQVWQGDE